MKKVMKKTVILFSLISIGACQRNSDSSSDTLGIGISGGGDSVFCKNEPGAKFDGNYSLDYLMSYDDATMARDDLKGESWEKIRERLEKLIHENLPGAEANFKDYLDSLLTNNPANRRQWVASSDGVNDIKDEDLIRILPKNCLKQTANGEYAINLTQSVWRKEYSSDLNERIFYYYNKENMEMLRKTRPLQFSYIVVHEWLWDYTLSPWVNRTLNRLFHTESAHSLTPEKFRTYMRTLGIEVSDSGTPIPREMAQSPLRKVFKENKLCDIEKYYVAEFQGNGAVHHISLGQGESVTMNLTIPKDAVSRENWLGTCGVAFVLNASKVMPSTRLDIRLIRKSPIEWSGAMTLGGGSELTSSFVHGQCLGEFCIPMDGPIADLLTPNLTNSARWTLTVKNSSSHVVSIQNPYLIHVAMKKPQ